MKRIIIACIASVIICVLCASCAEKPINIDVRELSDYIGKEIDLSNTVEYDDIQIKTNFGIDSEDVKQIIVLRELKSNSAEMIIFAQAADSSKAQEIKEKLNKIKEYNLAQLKDYTANPDNAQQYYIVENSEVWTEQDYVFWAVNSRSENIDAMIKNYIKNN